MIKINRDARINTIGAEQRKNPTNCQALEDLMEEHGVGPGP